MSKWTVKIEMTPDAKEGERYPNPVTELSVVIPDGSTERVRSAILSALIGDPK